MLQFASEPEPPSEPDEDEEVTILLQDLEDHFGCPESAYTPG